jgi:hypothetical protein
MERNRVMRAQNHIALPATMAVALLCCLAEPSAAQNSASNATQAASTSGSSASSGVASSMVTINSFAPGSLGGAGLSPGLSGAGTDPSGTTAGTSGASGTTDPTLRYAGQYTVKTAPAFAAPSLYGGTNPCTVGISGGVSVTGFGFGLGGQWSDRGCERRNSAVILFQANLPNVATALLCQDADIREAFRAAQRPCPQDQRPEATAAVEQRPPAPTPVVTPVAAVTPVQREVLPPIRPAVVSEQARPSWCNKPAATESDRAFAAHYCRS